MKVPCNDCQTLVDMSAKTCGTCGRNRIAEVRQAEAVGAATIFALFVGMGVGFLVAGWGGVICAAGIGLFIGFATMTTYAKHAARLAGQGHE